MWGGESKVRFIASYLGQFSFRKYIFLMVLAED